MAAGLMRWFCGDLTSKEIRNYVLLAFGLFFIVGAYWLMRPLKDAIFTTLVGIEYQPMAKMISLCVLVPLMLGYAKLVDILEKQKLFYLITISFIVLLSSLNLLLSVPGIGMENKIADPNRILGWAFYIAIESFGSIMVAMFWSFVTNSTNLSSAKKGFPLIIIVAQFGSILGPTLDTYATVLGIPFLMTLAILSMVMVLVLIFAFVCLNPIQIIQNNQNHMKKTGMFEGLRLLLTEPYVLAILAVATLFDVVYTIMDYQMKVLARQVYITPESFTEFLGHFGQSVNILALMFAITGTSYFFHKFGLKFCLVFFPISVALVILLVFVSPGLWQVFLGLVVIKGLAYGLNNPTKEIMYIPTTKDVQFKAKSWIDVFGNRGAKAFGSVVNHAFARSVMGLMVYGSIISLGVVGIWLIAAFYVGRNFEKITKEDRLIGAKESDTVLAV